MPFNAFNVIAVSLMVIAICSVIATFRSFGWIRRK
jgi:hypothetical protein